jgi:hypothetical protein
MNQPESSNISYTLDAETDSLTFTVNAGQHGFLLGLLHSSLEQSRHLRQMIGPNPLLEESIRMGEELLHMFLQASGMDWSEIEAELLKRMNQRIPRR